MTRRFEVLILPALLLAAIALPVPLMADRMPGPIATHWGLDGRPDGSADPTALWLSVTGVWLVLWAVLAVRAPKGGRVPEAVPVLALGGSLAALGLAAGGLFVDGAAGWILVESAVVVGIALMWVSIVRVTASERGLRIAFGPFGVPAKHMPLERIERAEATEIEPLRWGGLGYRWAGPGRSAVVVRRGPGLVLDLRDGSRFVVTVDEPGRAAGLLNDLRRRHAAG